MLEMTELSSSLNYWPQSTSTSHAHQHHAISRTGLLARRHQPAVVY